MKKPLVNFAFIDAQNLHKLLVYEGVKADSEKLRIYLQEKYAVKTAYMFMGYLPKYKKLYVTLKKAGFILIFKKLPPFYEGGIKGNCDAEMVLQIMKDWEVYEKAILITGDGDFYCVVKHLLENGKLRQILAPTPRGCSSLLKHIGKKVRKIEYITNLRKIISKI